MVIANKAELHSYLADTDYIDNKFIECIVSGGDVEALKAEKSDTLGMTYGEALEKRKEAREEINALESESAESETAVASEPSEEDEAKSKAC